MGKMDLGSKTRIRHLSPVTWTRKTSPPSSGASPTKSTTRAVQAGFLWRQTSGGRWKNSPASAFLRSKVLEALDLKMDPQKTVMPMGKSGAHIPLKDGRTLTITIE